MAKIIESRRILKSRLDAKQDVLRAIPALMGDGNGSVAIPNQPGYVYVRIGDGDLGQAFNNRCPQRDNLAVYVGYDPITDPDRRTFQVLSVRMSDYAGAGSTPIANVPPHHTYHEYGGGDDVYVDWRRLMGLRVGRPSGFSVTIDPGVILRAGAWTAIVSQTLDLGPTGLNLKPAGSTQARYVLISLNSTGTAIATAGAIVGVGVLDISDCPIPGAEEIPLAAIRLYGTQTAIGDTPSAPDIVDLRFPQVNTTGGANVYGAGVAGRVAYWSAVDTIASDAGLLYDAALNVLTLDGDIHFADDAIPIIRQISVNAQTTVDTAGNPLVFRSGAGLGTGAGGVMRFYSGDGGLTGGGGQFIASAGNGGATSGNGGDAEIAAGNATLGNGGNLTLFYGTSAGGGADGRVRLYNATSGKYASFNTSLIATSDKTFTFPNVSGTFALLEVANSFTLINPLTTTAESWIGPSSTAGIYFKGGFVGVGTIGPSRRLDIEGSDTNTTISNATLAAMAIVNTSGVAYNQTVELQFYMSNTANDHKMAGLAAIYIAYDGTNGVGADLAVYTKKSTDANPTERMRFLSTGAVGIGMLSPTYSLDVTGNFRCSTGFGCNGATPQTAYSTGGASAAFVQNSGNAINDASTIGGFTLLQVVQALRNIGVLA